MYFNNLFSTENRQRFMKEAQNFDPTEYRNKLMERFDTLKKNYTNNKQPKIPKNVTNKVPVNPPANAPPKTTKPLSSTTTDKTKILTPSSSSRTGMKNSNNKVNGKQLSITPSMSKSTVTTPAPKTSTNIKVGITSKTGGKSGTSINPIKTKNDATSNDLIILSDDENNASTTPRKGKDADKKNINYKTSEEESNLLDFNKIDITDEPSNYVEIDIDLATSISLTQNNATVENVNKRTTAITEKEFLEIMEKMWDPNDTSSTAYMITFLNADNNIEQMLADAFYQGFTNRQIWIRLQEHLHNGRLGKGPLAGLTAEQLAKVVIIPINEGRSTTNKIFEALFIWLEAELPPILKNRKYEPINHAEIESLININSVQRPHIINILHQKLLTAIQTFLDKDPTMIPHTRVQLKNSRFEKFLEILMDESKTPRERLLDALDFEHTHSPDDAPHHCYGVFLTHEDIDKMITRIIYFGETCRPLKIREGEHHGNINSAIYDELNNTTGQNYDFIQLIWEKTNKQKAKDLEAIQIYMAMKKQLHSEHLLLSSDKKLQPHLEIIRQGIHENLRTSIQRHKMENQAGRETEFIWYKCDWPNCKSKFGRSDHLNTHIRTHTGERPYECDWPNCEWTFTQSGGLIQHIRSHTGEQPYECDWPNCEWSFARSDSLNIHIRTHTGERPYECRNPR
uniref:C2H2-type domain-containing protein n=1 Tax=Panagrolaimus sp. ES5 TaxID=591445 RepID=A0AC34GT77_9BILA